MLYLPVYSSVISPPTQFLCLWCTLYQHIQNTVLVLIIKKKKNGKNKLCASHDKMQNPDLLCGPKICLAASE